MKVSVCIVLELPLWVYTLFALCLLKSLIWLKYCRSISLYAGEKDYCIIFLPLLKSTLLLSLFLRYFQYQIIIILKTLEIIIY